jgi:hypothetical protein
MHITVDALRSRPVPRLLADYFDFILNPIAKARPWFRVMGNHRSEVIAGDGSGNLYALLSNDGEATAPLLYVCHEGQAGVIARSLQEALQLFVSAPYWMTDLHAALQLAPHDHVIKRIDAVLAGDDGAVITLERRRPVTCSVAPPHDSYNAPYAALAASSCRGRCAIAHSRVARSSASVVQPFPCSPEM